MIIGTTDLAEVATAVRDLVKDWPAIKDINATVELGEVVNEDPGRCPWVGVYPLRSSFPPRVLGLGGGFRAQEIEFVVMCQQTHPTEGESALQLLGALVQMVTSALLTDPSLKGTVQTLGDAFDVELLGTKKLNDQLLQTAAIRGVGRTTVSGG